MRTILISAYGCEPLKGSEQGVGWNWILQMAKNNILHVITRANNQSAIESHLPDNLSENITFHYYDTNSFISSFKNKVFLSVNISDQPAGALSDIQYLVKSIK